MAVRDLYSEILGSEGGVTIHPFTDETNTRFPKAAEHRSAEEDQRELDKAFKDAALGGLKCAGAVGSCMWSAVTWVDTGGLAGFIMMAKCAQAMGVCRDYREKLEDWRDIRKDLKAKEAELEEVDKKEKEEGTTAPAAGGGGAGDAGAWQPAGADTIHVPADVPIINVGGGGGGGGGGCGGIVCFSGVCSTVPCSTM